MAALSNNDNAKLHSSEMHLTFTYTLLRKIVLGELRANQEQQNNLYLDHNLPCGIIVETVLSPYEVIGKQNLWNDNLCMRLLLDEHVKAIKNIQHKK